MITHMKTLGPFLGLSLMIAFPGPLYTAVMSSDEKGETVIQSPQEQSLQDHKAKVFNIQGTVLILRKSAADWEPLAPGSEIIEGDRLRTEAGSFVEIHYDDFYQNFVRIDEKTYAEFQSIEPTKVFLMDGEIFNTLEALPAGTSYEIATPTSIAGVRGTSFTRKYSSAGEEDETLVEDGTVDVFPVLDTQGTFDAASKIQVTREQSLQLTRAMIDKRDFALLKPSPMTPEQKQRIQTKFQAVRDGLQKFAGGPEAMQKNRAQWENIKNDPKRIEKIRDEQKKTPGGPGGPSGPGNQGPLNPNSQTADFIKKFQGPPASPAGNLKPVRFDHGNAPVFDREPGRKPGIGADPPKPFTDRKPGDAPGYPFPRENRPLGVPAKTNDPVFPPVYAPREIGARPNQVPTPAQVKQPQLQNSVRENTSQRPPHAAADGQRPSPSRPQGQAKQNKS